MSPRRSATEARHTRSVILDRGVEVASVEGLEGLTIGRLAADLGMSKSGLLGHFGSKEVLQLAVIDTAAGIFGQEVPGRVTGVESGLPRLRALCSAWVSYLERGVFPGGCFFTAAVAEFDDREGPVRDAIAGMVAVWRRDLMIQIRLATSVGELPADTDADQLMFELYGVLLSLNHSLRLDRDNKAGDRARRAIARLLGG
ncbi:TetR/AcrR family transcriptional regulator [Allokutzneria sp. A3M-2-11 16]|uniref:TetR/AcrR family transcriptional regulator n=1 Tax=Allokutzneria sp. A3M-2-11 16 TaxID=2962043 RepID=UPI0020B858FF|nr:TetR/AcrR family transcriptional regulator [Allokutzneria sp. A3M-2-11 16]MCP3803800.1 TetR/AcrR family transcriptional regulator [Allokutzneria sp. A3M-2-11 16]